jgi:2-hydroxychromene-2-carboxylate isomerase
VLARDLPAPESFEAFRCQTEQEIFGEELVRRARELELQPLRLPEPFPFDSEFAMLAATYAKSIGRTVAFTLAAFRQAFAGGHSLDACDYVLIAASACEIHPAAVLKAAAMQSVAEQLHRATAAAAAAGVSDVPAVRVGERVFIGERCPEEAAAYASSLSVR